MRTSIRAFSLLALLAAPAFCQPAPAPRAGEASLGGRLVYYVAADGDDGTWNPGVQARYFFNQVWAAEAVADYQRHSFPGTTVHTAVAQASGLAYFSAGPLRPFAAVGLGFYASRVHGPDYRRNLGKFAPHIGGGVEAILNPEWSVDLSYRHVFLSDIDSRDEATGAPRRFQRSGEQLSFAVNYRFGRR